MGILIHLFKDSYTVKCHLQIYINFTKNIINRMFDVFHIWIKLNIYLAHEILFLLNVIGLVPGIILQY